MTSLMGATSFDRGVDHDDPQAAQKIWQQYTETFRKGVYNFIREEVDPVSQEILPRKYFSGGARLDPAAVTFEDNAATVQSVKDTGLTEVSVWVKSLELGADTAVGSGQRMAESLLESPSVIGRALGRLSSVLAVAVMVALSSCAPNTSDPIIKTIRQVVSIPKDAISLVAKATKYGYPGDPYWDSNSAKGIGSFTTAMKLGDVALSRETARALHLEPLDTLLVRLPSGEVRVVRYADTIPSLYNEHRIDFYSPKGELRFDGVNVQLFANNTRNTGEKNFLAQLDPRKFSADKTLRIDLAMATDQPAPEETSDNAMADTTKGGIDLDSSQMGLAVEGGAGQVDCVTRPEDPACIQVRFTPEQIRQIRSNLTGLTPVIIGIQPLESLPRFLGVRAEDGPSLRNVENGTG